MTNDIIPIPSAPFNDTGAWINELLEAIEAHNNRTRIPDRQPEIIQILQFVSVGVCIGYFGIYCVSYLKNLYYERKNLKDVNWCREEVFRIHNEEKLERYKINKLQFDTNLIANVIPIQPVVCNNKLKAIKNWCLAYFKAFGEFNNQIYTREMACMEPDFEKVRAVFKDKDYNAINDAFKNSNNRFDPSFFYARRNLRLIEAELFVDAIHRAVN